jgi:hypothetical protein
MEAMRGGKGNGGRAVRAGKSSTYANQIAEFSNGVAAAARTIMLALRVRETTLVE